MHGSIIVRYRVQTRVAEQAEGRQPAREGLLRAPVSLGGPPCA